MSVTVPPYTGTVPNRNQNQTVFNENVNNMLAYQGNATSDGMVAKMNEQNTENNTINANVNLKNAETNTNASLALSNANATLYSGSATYDNGDTVIGTTTGNAYRCLSDGTTGDDPESSTTGDWSTALLVTPDSSYGENLIINSHFGLDQDSVGSGPVTINGLSASPFGSEYGHDMWTVFGTAGMSVTYTVNDTDSGDVTINSCQNTTGSSYNIGLATRLDELYETTGELITISFEVVSLDSSLILFGSGANDVISTVGKKNITVTSSGDGALALYASVPATSTTTPNFRFKKLKVERGSVYTGWKRPIDAQEQLRSYRYYFVDKPPVGTVSEVLSSTTAEFSIKTPVPMATVHTVTSSGVDFYNIDKSYNDSTTSLNYFGNRNGHIAVEATGLSTISDDFLFISPSNTIKLDARY